MLKHLTLDITPLRVSRDYRLLFFGQLVSFFGSMMTFIVVPWQMFRLTGSSEMVGYLYLAEFVPMFCLAFVGGALADFLDKRKMLRLTEIGQTIVTAILLINSLLPAPQIWILFVAVALHAGFAAIQRPAFESFIQKVIPVDLMSAVMALNSIRYSIGAIVSPAIAGVIATQFSPAAAYTIDLLTFAASLGAVFLIRAVPSPANAERPSWQSIKNGWAYAFSRQELLGTYLIDIAAMFFAMPQALYPALAAVYGEKYVGFFPASIAAGALLASITSGWTKNIHRHGLMVTGNLSRLDLESNDSEFSARAARFNRNDFLFDGSDARQRENGRRRRTLRLARGARFRRRSVRRGGRRSGFAFAEVCRLRRTRGNPPARDPRSHARGAFENFRRRILKFKNADFKKTTNRKLSANERRGNRSLFERAARAERANRGFIRLSGAASGARGMQS